MKTVQTYLHSGTFFDKKKKGLLIRVNSVVEKSILVMQVSVVINFLNQKERIIYLIYYIQELVNYYQY